MISFDFLRLCEIGNGARHFENSVVGAGRERELLHGVLQEVTEALVETAIFANLPMGH